MCLGGGTRVGEYGADTIEQNVTIISYIQDDRMTVKERCDELS